MPAGRVDDWYSTGVYARLQPAITRVTDLSGWAFLDVLAAVALVSTIGFVARGLRRWRRSEGRARRCGVAAGLVTTAILAAVCGYLLFLALWGLNYRRAPVEARIGFDAARVTPAQVEALARRAVRALNALHGDAHARPFPAADALPQAFGPLLGATADALDLGWAPRPGRPKRTLMAPYFTWAGIAGMTNPFGLEVIPSPDTLPFERHAVMAHEWAHLAGFAHEAEAGFVGWMMCARGDAQARYSGWLSVWGSLVWALPAATRASVADTLGPGPRADLAAMAARNARAVPTVRNAAWRGYDAYLRSQRVSEGVASYDGVVRLLAGADPRLVAEDAR